MGGFEATEKIREWERDNNMSRSPIIALTAHAMVGDREKCIQAQMDVCVTGLPCLSAANPPAGVPFQASETEPPHPNHYEMCHPWRCLIGTEQ